MATKKTKERVDFTAQPLKSKKGDQRYAPAGNVVRMEIICTQALEEDFRQEFDEHNVAARYTKLASVMGAGYSNLAAAQRDVHRLLQRGRLRSHQRNRVETA